MNHKYVQLELFALPGITVDEKFGEEMTPILLKQLQDRKARITHSIIHPSTLTTYLPNLGDRTTWDAITFGDVAVNRKRVKTFYSSMTCSCCGREGNVYVIEEDVNNPHGGKYLNLYHVTDESVVEMTVDHTLPKSFAGADTHHNRNTMCYVCNQDKANVLSYGEVMCILPNLKKHLKDWANEEYIAAVLKLHLLMTYVSTPAENHRIKGLVNKYLSCVQPGTKPTTYAEMLNQLNSHIDTLTKPTAPPAPEPVVVKSSWFDNIVAHILAILRVN